MGLSAWGKLRLIGEIVVAYCRVRLGMRRAEPIEVAAAERRRGEARPQEMDGVARDHLADAVERVLSVLPTDSPCLVNSLTLLSLLATRGVQNTLVIGVRPGSDFAAHAWVESDGRALLPTGGGEYQRLAEI